MSKVRIEIKVDEHWAQALEDMSDKSGMSRTQIITEILQDALHRNARGEPVSAEFDFAVKRKLKKWTEAEIKESLKKNFDK